jgi:hypothetical protein
MADAIDVKLAQIDESFGAEGIPVDSDSQQVLAQQGVVEKTSEFANKHSVAIAGGGLALAALLALMKK